MSNKIKALIAVSLCMNLLLAGIIVGMDMSYQKPKSYFKDDIVASKMKHFHKRHKASYEALHEEREKAMKILAGEHIDPEAYIFQMNKVNKQQMELLEEISLEMMKIFQQLSPEERKSVLKGMKNRPPPIRKF